MYPEYKLEPQYFQELSDKQASKKWAKYLNRHFTRRVMQRASNKQKLPSSLFLSSRTEKSNKTDNTTCCQGGELTWILTLCWWARSKCFKKLFIISYKVKHSSPLWLSNYIARYLPKRNENTCLQENKNKKTTCINVWTVALFIITQSWRQPGSPHPSEWINNMWHIPILEKE